jgi:hypothetical protein
MHSFHICNERANAEQVKLARLLLNKKYVSIDKSQLNYKKTINIDYLKLLFYMESLPWLTHFFLFEVPYLHQPATTKRQGTDFLYVFYKAPKIHFSTKNAEFLK